MKRILLVSAAILLAASHPSDAVTISPSQDLAAVPLNPGTGLLGNYYKFPTAASVGSMSNANVLISSSGGPTATFTTSTICFPDCAGTSISDSNMMTAFLNGHASNFAYTSANQPPAIDHSAITLTGYIAITQTGTYNFNLGSDDGSALTIGGTSVINNDSDHVFSTASGAASFSQTGLYAISIEYFEDAGVTGLDFYGSDPTGNCVIGRSGSNCGSTGSVATSLFYSTLPAAAAPEPASLLILSAGLVALALVRRRLFSRIGAEAPPWEEGGGHASCFS